MTMAQPGRNLDTEQWQELDRLHHLHPFTDSKALHRTGSRIITRADGVYLWDSDGRKILDAMAGLWCVNVGYGREDLARVAYEQMQELPYYNNFFQTTHPPAVDLAEVLSQVTPEHLNHVFFTNSGSEANDTVVRMVRRYWDIKGRPERTVIISRENAYHGSTMAGASLGGMKPMHRQGGMPIPDIEHITQPYWYALGGSLSPEEFGLQAARALETRIKALGANRVAAFIGEPIQGAGGVIVPPESYWPEIVRICKKHGILLVADEVICGFGRTGKWFGSEFFGIEPDLMPIAKGLSSGYLPIGGVMVSDAVADVLINRGGEFQHGFTYAGNPLSCAAGLAVTEELLKRMPQGSIEKLHTAAFLYYQAGQPDQAILLLNKALERVRSADQKALLLYHATLIYVQLKDQKNTFGSLYYAINNAEHLGLIRDIEQLWEKINEGPIPSLPNP